MKYVESNWNDNLFQLLLQTTYNLKILGVYIKYVRKKTFEMNTLDMLIRCTHFNWTCLVFIFTGVWFPSNSCKKAKEIKCVWKIHGLVRKCFI